MIDRKKTGQEGEDIAVKFLKNKGYKIIERNFLKRVGEVDIIAKSPQKEWVFIEVKTRKTKEFGHPEEAVTPRKLRKILATAQHWLNTKKIISDDYRIDVIAIQWEEGEPNILHLEGV